MLPVNGLNPSGHRCRSATSPDGEASLAGFARAKKAPLSKGAGRVSGLGDSDGPCLIARYTRRRPGIPPPRLRSAPPFDKGGFLRGRSPQKGAPRSGVTPRCAGRCREATEGFGSEGLAEPARPEGLCRALRYIPSTGTLPPTPRGASRTPPPTALTASLPATRRGGIHPSRAPYAAASSLVKKLTAQILRFLACKSAPYVVQYKLTKYGKNRRNSKWNTAIRS